MKTVADIYEECKEKYDLHLRAGQSGLDREVRWVYQAEDLDSLSFIRGGEIVVSTGLTSLDGHEWFMDMLTGLAGSGASALIVNTGKYIKPSEAAPDIRSGFDKAGIPLFLMPWNVHISDLTQEISGILFSQRRDNDLISGIFSDMLLDSAIKPSHALKLESFGFREEASYNVMCISGARSESAINRIFKSHGINHHILHSDETLIVIYEYPGDEGEENICEELFSACHARKGDPACSDTLIIGMGEHEYALSRVKFSYINAKNALKAAISEGVNYIRFRDMGIYQILLSIEDIDLLKRLEREYLGALVTFDNDNNSDYLDTLETYILCGGSVNETAAKLHTHRNTINYRIHKIKEIMPFDMDDPDSHFMIKMALYVHKNLL